MAIIFYFIVFLFSFEKFCQKFRLSALKRIILSIYGNYLSFSFFHSKNSVTFRLLTLERIIRGFLLSDGISRLKNDFLPFRYSRTNERVFSRRKNYCRYVYIYIFEYDSLLFQSLFLFFQSLLFRYRTTVRVTPPLLLRKIYLSLS